MKYAEFYKLIEEGNVKIGEEYFLQGFMPGIPHSKETVFNVSDGFADTMNLHGNIGEANCRVCEKRHTPYIGTETLRNVPLGSSSYHNLLNLKEGTS